MSYFSVPTNSVQKFPSLNLYPVIIKDEFSVCNTNAALSPQFVEGCACRPAANKILFKFWSLMISYDVLIIKQQCLQYGSSLASPRPQTNSTLSVEKPYR